MEKESGIKILSNEFRFVYKSYRDFSKRKLKMFDENVNVGKK